MQKSIKCKVDDLGRIVLPIQYRRALGILPKDKVDIEFKNNGIFVFKQTEKDVLNNKIGEVVLAVSECKEIDPKEVATVVSILSKLVKAGEKYEN